MSHSIGLTSHITEQEKLHEHVNKAVVVEAVPARYDK